MVEGKAIIIKDTGKDAPNGTNLFTKINNGEWIELPSGSINFEFNTISTNYESMVVDETTNFFKPQSNEVTAILPPRITVRCLVPATDTATIQNIILLGRSRGLKMLSGGLGVIDALPEAVDETYGTETRKAVYIIIKNIAPSEVIRNGTNYISFTIQMEQVVN